MNSKQLQVTSDHPTPAMQIPRCQPMRIPGLLGSPKSSPAGSPLVSHRVLQVDGFFSVPPAGNTNRNGMPTMSPPSSYRGLKAEMSTPLGNSMDKRQIPASPAANHRLLQAQTSLPNAMPREPYVPPASNTNRNGMPTMSPPSTYRGLKAEISTPPVNSMDKRQVTASPAADHRGLLAEKLSPDPTPRKPCVESPCVLPRQSAGQFHEEQPHAQVQQSTLKGYPARLNASSQLAPDVHKIIQCSLKTPQRPLVTISMTPVADYRGSHAESSSGMENVHLRTNTNSSLASYLLPRASNSLPETASTSAKSLCDAPRQPGRESHTEHQYSLPQQPPLHQSEEQAHISFHTAADLQSTSTLQLPYALQRSGKGGLLKKLVSELPLAESNKRGEASSESPDTATPPSEADTATCLYSSRTATPSPSTPTATPPDSPPNSPTAPSEVPGQWPPTPVLPFSFEDEPQCLAMRSNVIQAGVIQAGFKVVDEAIEEGLPWDQVQMLVNALLVECQEFASVGQNVMISGAPLGYLQPSIKCSMLSSQEPVVIHTQM